SLWICSGGRPAFTKWKALAGTGAHRRKAGRVSGRSDTWGHMLLLNFRAIAYGAVVAHFRSLRGPISDACLTVVPARGHWTATAAPRARREEANVYQDDLRDRSLQGLGHDQGLQTPLVPERRTGPARRDRRRLVDVP